MGISLSKMETQAPDLVNLYKTAAVSLRKKGLQDVRAAVYLVLDHSGSMERLYSDGTVQRFTEKVLALSANVDDDGVVPVVFFHDGVHPAADATVGQHRGVIDTMRRDNGVRWGATNYAPAMQAVVNHYQQSGATDPALVVFETDGQAGDEGQAAEALKRFSPMRIFWQFVGFGEHASREFRFLRKLDDLRGRRVDNAGFFGTLNQGQGLTDEQLYDNLVGEFSTWRVAAQTAGIL